MSILTPSLNQVAWLPDALGSVACQTYPRIEHIVMDGASVDGSLKILREAADRVSWRSEPDQGQSDALNKAFAVSRGEIIGWINSDDAYFDCRVVERVVAFLADRRDIDVVYGHAARTTEDGRIVEILWAPPYRRRRLRAHNFIVQPAAFVRRSAVTEPLLDETFHFAMDWELWLRVARTHRFARLNRILAIDRHQSSRKTEQMTEVFLEDVERLAATYGQRYPRWWGARARFYYLWRRLAGGMLVLTIPRRLAYASPSFSRARLWWRLMATRRRDWPEEFR